jgi:hypothetical protein
MHDIELLRENVQNQEDEIHTVEELMYGRSRGGPCPETHGWGGLLESS